MNRAERRASAKNTLILPASASPPQGLVGVGGTSLAPTVGVGFCHPGASTNPLFARSLRFLYQRDARGHNPPWIVGEYDHESSGAHVPDARNTIVNDFLVDPQKPEWLLCIDDDATFNDELLDDMLAVAHPTERPIVGALAFGVAPRKDANGVEQFNDVMGGEWELFPTIYVLTEDGGIGIWVDYPRDTLISCFSTGGHCFIVHRSVLADPRWLEDEHPQPWFRIVPHGPTRVISEDQFFFIKAGSFGYPVHVHSGIKTGHVKTYIADEELFERQRAAVAPDIDLTEAEPTE